MSTLLVILLGSAYGAGIWKFLAGFRRTNFSSGRVYLALLWPVLIFNKSYRQNFSRALTGR